MRKESVAVVGAGTAGLIAARSMAAAGIKTVVYDQKSVPGERIHASGILSLTGLETLGMDYTKAMTNTLKGANIHAGGKTMRIRSAEPVAVVLDRKRLNGLCIENAEKAGAEVEVGRRISGRDIDAFARDNIIIGADGAVSTVAKHFGMGSIGSYSITYKQEYNVPIAEPDVVDLFFDNRSWPGLFAWLCPNAKDLLEVGVGTTDHSVNSRRVLEKFLDRRDVSDIIGVGKPVAGGASIIPMSRRRSIVDPVKEVLLVGDAAGQIKATTGGGIIFGSNAALLAADAAREHIRNGADLSVYERMFMSKYGTEMRLHSMINRFYSSLGPGAIGRIISISKAVGMEGFLGKYGDMDRPSLVLKRFFLRGLAD